MKRGKREIKREFEYKEKKSNKKTIIILAVTIIALFILFFVLKNLVLTTKVIEKPYTPENCSNESIRKVWESLFKGSSENLTIVTAPDLNESDSSLGMFIMGGCPVYSVYQTDGTKLKLIVGIDMWFFMDMNMIYAIQGQFKPEKIANLTSSLSNYSESYSGLLEITLMGFEENNENNSLLPRNISTLQEAKLNFESIFNVSSSNWTIENLTEDPEIINLTIYSFNESEQMKNITVFGESIDPLGIIAKAGMVFGNSSLDEYIYTETSLLGILESLEKKFGNWTSPINTSLKNITIEVNNSKLKMSDELNLFSEKRSGKQEVEIMQNNQTIIETEINFTEDFDWTKIILKKQDINSTRGYVIINGLNYTKNITLDRLNNKSEAVCVKDSEINSINEISRGCNYTNEYLVRCLGNSSNNQTNITCRISGGKFFIKGLTHSAVIEILPLEENAEPCIQNWICDDWTEYEEQCGYRTCTDVNTCNNISTKPLEYKECPVCIPNWECTTFIPEKCPKSEKRTRTCEDLNNCGKEGEMPNITQNCHRKNSWIWIALGTGVGIILLLILILFLGKKGNRPAEEGELKEPPKPQEKFYKENPGFPSKKEQKDASNQTESFKQQVKPDKVDEDEFYYPEQD